MIRSLIIAAVAAVSLSSTAYAVDNPATLNGARIVSPEEAKTLVDKGAKVFDVRSKNEYAELHIKGATSLAYKEKSDKKADFDASVDSFDLSALPSDKAAALIFYCNGLECWKSYKASTTAVKAGYTGVNWLREGLPGWKAKGYPVE